MFYFLLAVVDVAVSTLTWTLI